MYRTVTRLLGLSVGRRPVEGTVVETPAEVAVVDHAATRRRTSEGTHLAVTVHVRNDGDDPQPPVPVRVRFFQSRWLGRREAAMAPVERATEPLAPGVTTTVEVGWGDADGVVRYELAVGSEE